MKGKEVFKTLTSYRDYSGSEADEYAQLLLTIESEIGSSIYPLLEVANQENKKLTVSNPYHESIIIADVALISHQS